MLFSYHGVKKDSSDNVVQPRLYYYNGYVYVLNKLLLLGS